MVGITVQPLEKGGKKIMIILGHEVLHENPKHKVHIDSRVMVTTRGGRDTQDTPSSSSQVPPPSSNILFRFIGEEEEVEEDDQDNAMMEREEPEDPGMDAATQEPGSAESPSPCLHL